jgi:phosphoglycerate dehydrogenase-like enzyme
MLRDGRWRSGKRPAARRSLGGQKIGIVGLGDIGKAMAVRAEAFGMQVSWWGPRPKPDARWPRVDSLLELAKASDILALCAQATPENEGMVSREVIEALGPEGILVNVARGSLVDEDEMIAALKDGRLGAAGLDVFVEEPTPPERWAGLDNVALTPHFAGGTRESVVNMTGQALENLRRHFAGEPLLSPVRG